MIELRHLRYFIAVAEELNFHRAAERVHIDQSPLSRAVRDLEDHLGILLFARTPRTLRLTPAGERLLTDARELFASIERTKRAVRETDARYRAPLRIGVADGLAQPRLSFCFASWQRLVPHTPLELQELSACELADGLRREELDIGISFGVQEEDAIVQEHAWSAPLVAVVPIGHELAPRSALPLSELVAHPMIACSHKHLPGVRRQVDAIVHRHSEAPILSGEARTLAGLITRVAAGLGVGLADAGHMQMLRRDDVVAIPLEEQTATLATLVLHKRHRFALPEALQRFLTHATSL